ncbi:MAG: AAA family ATPase [Acidobacteria bacterium]|nr:AAA family ATPase [Acidobacteriota bacterium]
MKDATVSINWADLLHAEEQKHLAASDDQAAQPNETIQLGYTFRKLQLLALPPRDEMMRGLARQEIGLLNAVTNIGKTTLIRNLALCIITGRSFPPLLINDQRRRVAIIDNEDTLTFLRSDLNKMLEAFSDEEKDLVHDGLFLICEASIAGEELTLNKPEHFELVIDQLTEFRPDIIFIDTISQTFAINDENHNSEVKERVMKPLKRLAKQTNAAVMAAHHIGKAKLEEGSTREGSHRGRGASSFGDQSRVILNLERDLADASVILSCPKLKGENFPNQILKLNAYTRWFERVGENRIPTNYEMVIEMFSDGNTYQTSEVVDAFAGEIPKRSIQRMLRDGVERGDLQKVRQGFYQKNSTNLIDNSESAKVPTV